MNFFIAILFFYVIIENENDFQIGDFMEKRDKYKTSNKTLLMNYIKNIDKSFSVKDLYNIIKSNDINIGLTTIYRYLDELTNKKILKKYYDEKNTALYQYLNECEKTNHFYLKCNHCGELIHIDCDCILELHNHIYNEHKFITDDKNIIINGLCSKCLGGKKC